MVHNVPMTMSQCRTLQYSTYPSVLPTLPQFHVMITLLKEEGNVRDGPQYTDDNISVPFSTVRYVAISVANLAPLSRDDHCQKPLIRQKLHFKAILNLLTARP